jgi:hypothetical protein
VSIKPDPSPAVVLALPRSGTTFLCHALSNHPEIFCPRDEPIHPRGWSYRYFNSMLTAVDVLKFIHNQAFYSVNMCKVMYYQVTEEVMRYLAARKAKIIHLVREDLVRLTVSQVITAMTDEGRIIDRPILSHRPSIPISVYIDPTLFMQTLLVAEEQVARWRGILSWYPALEVKYADMVGGEGSEAKEILSDVANEICDFLGVSRHPLDAAGLKTVNTPYPLERLVANWDEIKGAMKNEIPSG